MTKRKRLAKDALDNPELYTHGELTFFQLWLDEKRRVKTEKKKAKDEESVYSSDKDTTIAPKPAKLTMTVIKDETGKMNVFAKEPEVYTDPEHDYSATYAEKAERLNGLFAMIGVIAALGAYACTGQIIPGVW